jgi:hypothetical protein
MGEPTRRYSKVREESNTKERDGQEIKNGTL